MRKLISVLLCFLMLSCAVTAHAAELNSLISAHELAENTLFLYTTVLPENGNLTVTVKDEQLENPQLTTVRAAHLPVTVYCLVDLSTHLTDKQFQQTKDALKTINSRMGEKDTMVITTVGKVITEGAVLDTYEARNTAIDTLKRDVYNVDMYQAIADAATSLQTKTNYNANRCLLILSDGDGYKKGQLTQQDAANAISKVDFPVYALGVTGSQSYKDATRKAQNIIKMAELTIGGIGLVPADESITAAQATEKIWEHIQESNVIQIDLSAVTAADNATMVHAVYDTNGERFEGTVVIDLTFKASEEIDTEDIPVTLADAPTEPNQSQPSEGNVFLIGGVAAGLLVLVVVIVVVARKRKNANILKESATSAEQKKMLDSNVIFEDDLTDNRLQTQQVADMQNEKNNYPKTTFSESAEADVAVQFAVVSHKDVKTVFSLKPHVPQVLGRDDRADIILNNEDTQLSGRHCNVEWDGNHLYIQDAGSTNGTYINKVRLKPNAWSRLETDMVVTMGSFDYLVTIC